MVAWTRLMTVNTGIGGWGGGGRPGAVHSVSFVLLHNPPGAEGSGLSLARLVEPTAGLRSSLPPPGSSLEPSPPPPPGQVQPQFLCYRPPNPGFACGSPICCRSSAPTLQPFWVRPLQPHGAEACLPSSAQGCRPGRALGVPTGRGRCVPGSLIIETDPKVACQWAASFLGVCL